MDDAAAAADVRFRCPGCDEEVDVAAGLVGQLVRCPYCNTSFFAAHGHTQADVVDDTARPHDDGPPPTDELNAVRIRQLTTLRQATLRTRSWWVIAMLMAGSTAADLLFKAGRYVAHYHAWGLRPTLFVLGGSVAVAATVVTGRLARQLGREAAMTTLPPPAQPPDFSTLDDGSNRWRHLEHLR